MLKVLITPGIYMTGLYMPGKFQVKADTFYPHACDDIAFMAYES